MDDVLALRNEILGIEKQIRNLLNQSQTKQYALQKICDHRYNRNTPHRKNTFVICSICATVLRKSSPKDHQSNPSVWS